MDSIFGIGPMELALILIIAAVVMGPERMVRTARWLGQAVSQMQNVTQNLRAQLEKEIDGLDDDGQLRETIAEMKTLQREVNELRQQVQNTTTDTLAGAAGTTAVSKPEPENKDEKEEPAELENSIRPPQLAEPAPPPSDLNGSATAPETLSDTTEQSADLPRVLSVADDPE